MFAIFEDVGLSEILVLGVAGVLLFGKRLPEVASQAGAQLVKFRRSLQQVKNDSGLDQEVRKIQRTIEEAIPRDMSVGEVARLASARVQDRIQSARKELDDELGKPVEEATGGASVPQEKAPPPAPAEPPHDPRRVGPPASDTTIARIKQAANPPPQPPQAPAPAPAPEPKAPEAEAGPSAPPAG